MGAGPQGPAPTRGLRSRQTAGRGKLCGAAGGRTRPGRVAPALLIWPRAASSESISESD